MNNKYQEIEEVYLHDSLINAIEINYVKKELEFKLALYNKGERRKNVLCRFQDFVHFDISNYGPWGKGVYIFEANIIKESDLLRSLKTFINDIQPFLHYCFILTSGDKINIVSKKFEIDMIVNKK